MILNRSKSGADLHVFADLVYPSFNARLLITVSFVVYFQVSVRLADGRGGGDLLLGQPG